MNITSLDHLSKTAKELNYQLNKEWPDIGYFEKEKYGVSIPEPIGVLIDGVVVGGLSFTSHKAPQGNEIAIWVNALLVQPRYRHKGIARKLILAAQSTSKILFALTDIPELYTKAGWQTVYQDKGGTIVKYENPS